MKQTLLFFLLLAMPDWLLAQQIASPDKRISVSVELNDGHPFYNVRYKGNTVIALSSLGVVMKDSSVYGHFKSISSSAVMAVHDAYHTLNAKRSNIAYKANKRVFTLVDDKGNNLKLVFQVSNDGVVFRYLFPSAVSQYNQLERELTTYHFDPSATAWLEPKAEAKTGFEHTNPSYEENYKQDVNVGAFSKTGWVYPALFKSAETWLLITEAGMDGTYPGTNLYNESGSTVYHVSYPDTREEIPGQGTLPRQPSVTPWRVIAIGTLKTIVESTLGTDVAIPAKPIGDQSYIRPGKASWSWIMSKDDSITYTETKRYIDFAQRMHWQYCLIDANWDTKIGYDKVAELARYAAAKDVGLLLWYNSAGNWNTVKMTPKDKMLTDQSRDEEFTRLKTMGIKGIKIDFFGGDGQSMIKYYTDILNSAAKYNLLVNFHGATLPRGWARTYPNLVSTEAVKGFEMITFSQGAANDEPNHGTMLPYTRNVFDPMDFTPMNLYKIQGRVKRKTTTGFELATSVIYLSGIQHYAESPDGMAHMPDFVISNLQQLPDHWDDVRFLEGYPGKLAVIARKGKGVWYIAAMNGEEKPKEISLDLSVFGANQAELINDGNDGQLVKDLINLDKNKNIKISLKPNGGFFIRLSKP